MNKPEILKEGTYNQNALDKFLGLYTSAKVIDIFEGQLKELFEISNPELLFDSSGEPKAADFLKSRLGNIKQSGSWIYYPWKNTLLHTLNESELISLRTNRNRNLITLEEQKKLYDCTIAIAGMSIGNNMLQTLNYSAIVMFSKSVP